MHEQYIFWDTIYPYDTYIQNQNLESGSDNERILCSLETLC